MQNATGELRNKDWLSIHYAAVLLHTAPMHFLWQKVKAMGAPIVPCLIHSWGGKGTKIDVAGPVR